MAKPHLQVGLQHKKKAKENQTACVEYSTLGENDQEVREAAKYHLGFFSC